MNDFFFKYSYGWVNILKFGLGTQHAQ